VKGLPDVEDYLGRSSLHLHTNTVARKWGLSWFNGQEVDERKTENLRSSRLSE
jgi:hypothetical protein